MKLIVVPVLVALAVASPGWAKDKKDAAPPAIYQAVVDCRAIADAGQRLACFDRTVGEMTKAGEEKELVVLDRETMRETRKGLFGFNLPKLKLFGSNDEDANGQDRITEIESTVTGLRSAKDGFTIFTIEDGARWKQTDGRNLYPKVGQKIKIKAAALGSYMASIEGRAGVRVMRLPE